MSTAISPSTEQAPSRSPAFVAALPRLLRHPRAPLWLLGGLSLFSLGARLWDLDKPFNADKHSWGLIFDESYYVNAAKVILGIHPTSGAYVTAPLFHDPNAEHPPLVKLLIAGTVKLFGDNPYGWRIGAVVFGTVALLAMYWLVRAAGGSSWLALGAAAAMAVDNLMLVHGRIGTLDIFVVTFMLIAVALYLRGHPFVAGVVLGVGLCTKLVAIDAVFVLILIELARVVLRPRDETRPRAVVARARLLPLLATTGISLATYVALLYALDLIASPVGGPGACPTVSSGFHNPFLHTDFMLCYAGKLTNPAGPTGIASYPWQWLINQVPINYFTLSTNVFSAGKQVATHTVIAFKGEMNPAIIFLALPALGLAIRQWFVERDQVSLLVVAWFLATFLPFVVAAAPLGSYGNRTSYLYYMVIVLPAIYVGVAQLFSRRWLPLAALCGYVAIVGYWFVELYPMRTLSGS